MKSKIFVLFMLTLMLWSSVTLAYGSDKITPFEYSFAVPTADDLTKEEAEAIADAYFSQHNDRILLYHEDISQYQKATNFIRRVQNEQVTYCWVVAYNDGVFVSSTNGFIGMVIISSPDGRILDNASDYYCTYGECFADWKKAFSSRSEAEVYGMIDLIALPADNRVKHLLPDMNTIREEEALQIANRLVSGYRRTKAEDVHLDYDITITLEQNLLISDYPFWLVQYVKYPDSPEDKVNLYHYTIAVYAHTGTLWYVIDRPAKKVIYADYTYCNLPLTEDSFSPAEWELTDAHFLFAAS